MRVLMRSHFWLYLGAVVLIGVALLSMIRVISGPKTEYITEVVSIGTVREVVSVSGLIDADNTANLTFPVTGIVDSVTVGEGDTVSASAVLATLERADLLADRADALAALQIAEADLDELIAGPRLESRDVTALSVETAEEDLIRVTREEQEKVDNARRSLLSDDLEAFPMNRSSNATTPTITGTYNCTEEGVYVLEMYASGAKSGYSYRLTGLGTGTYSAFTTAPAALGDCGLAIEFPDSGTFGSTDWEVPVPNVFGDSYASNLNSYELAIEQRDSAIAEAEEALELAQKEERLENAVPRNEALRRAEATVLQTKARLTAVDAAISDHIIRAPFSGVITDAPTKPGETISGETAIEMISDEAFELTARIPEIDIAKVSVGQRADVVFDAAVDEMLVAEIVFISPLATEIDGVAYFQATLAFTNPPHWLRSGLNADVEVIIREAADVLRLPQRFVTERDGSYYVLIQETEGVIEQEITVGLFGNDGFVEVSNLPEGQAVIAP